MDPRTAAMIIIAGRVERVMTNLLANLTANLLARSRVMAGPGF
jgi:hypothetical protein